VELAIDWNAHRNCSIPAAINGQAKRRFRIRFCYGPDAIFPLEAGREVIEVIQETCGMVIVS
jgi:hypothetical protein